MNAHESLMSSSARAGGPQRWRTRVHRRLVPWLTAWRRRWHEGSADVLSFCAALLVAGLAAVLLGSLHGCGGGVGIEGTGSSYASGPITGYGSIVVNGVHFDEAGASVLDDDDGELTRSQLALGMVVQVDAGAIATAADGTQQATATRVRAIRTLVGPPTVSAAGQFSVLGQPVLIDAATVFDASFTQGLTSVARAAVVTVYGDHDGTRVHATRIAPAAAGSTYSVRGPVSAVDATQQTCTIGDQVYSLSSTSGLADGAVLKLALKGSTDGSGRWLTQAQQAQRNLPEGGGAEVEIEGVVSLLSSATRFVVDGVTVDAGSARVNGTVGAGLRVAVRGSVRSGVLVATRVDVSGDSQARSFELRGTLTTVDLAAQRIVVQVSGRSTAVSLARTDLVYERGSAAALAVGVAVRVTGVLAADRLTLDATHIRVGD